MGRLARIKELFNKQLPAHIEGNPIFRGLAFPLDDFLRGPVRFSKKLGAFLPIYVPNNSFKLERAITPPIEQLVVDTILPGMEVGSILSIAGRELVEVEDFDTEQNSIGLTSKVRANYTEGTTIVLFSVPMLATAAASIGSTTLSVKSSFRIYPGDKVLVPTGTLLEAFETIAVTASTQTGTSGSDFLFDLTLNTGISVEVAADDKLYIRAFPAYESPSLLLPENHSQGPFVYDYISGALIDSAYKEKGSPEIEETLTVSLLDISGAVLEGPIVSDKNSLVAKVPIRNDVFLFWDLIEGRLNYDGEVNRTMLTTNDEGRASILQHLVPNVGPDSLWQANFIADQNCTVVVQFGDNPSVSFPLTSGVPATGSVGVLASEDPADRVNISVLGPAKTTVRLGDWTTSGSRISQIKYSVVAEVTGFYTWGASGIIMKPMFLSLDLITANSDFSIANNGGIFL